VSEDSKAPTPAPFVERNAAWLGLALSLLIIGYVYSDSDRQRRADDGMDYAAFGALPALHQGRVQPLDSVARNSLAIIAARQSLRVDGTKVAAIRWLTQLMFQHEKASAVELFRVDHPDLKGLLGVTDPKKNLFSYEQLVPALARLDEQARLAHQLDSKQWSLYQRRVVELREHIQLYERLRGHDLVRVIPPLAPGEEWRTLVDMMQSQAESPALTAWGEIYRAYQTNDATAFNAAVAGYAATVSVRLPDAAKARTEAAFNTFDPFGACMYLYVIAFILACGSWLGATRPLVRAAFAILGVSLVVHTLGLAARVYIMDRPPVTNLYSSAVFIGWGAGLFSSALERIFKNSIGIVCASVIGFSTLLVAQGLSLDGDTMAMLQAVLDTNFWLATHVVVITLGYASTFLAGLLATIYILRGLLTRSLDKDTAKSLQQMVYGTICFAILFSFVGTILGGLWADQSWGRFWGWDPKENGALLIVLWNALVLHARWGGMVRQRGLMALAVFGNIVTAWSWFGTNMLGVGLHSYGFMDAAFYGLVGFCFTQLALIGLATIPLPRWRSAAGIVGNVAEPKAPAA
jgi:ABC-type transport system involved in cytochrome c biogenesis permease subunit